MMSEDRDMMSEDTDMMSEDRDSMSEDRDSMSEGKHVVGHSLVLLAALCVQGAAILAALVLADWLYCRVLHHVPALYKELILWACVVWLPLGCVLCCLGSCMEVINAWR